MIYFHPPYLEFDGVTVLGDYHDPNQFYYFPNRPHIALDEQGRPAIRLFLLKRNLEEIDADEDEAVGLLVFDTSLSWPEDKLDAVRDGLSDELDLDGEPRLAPLPYSEGSVRLMFLGEETEPADDGEPDEGSEDEEDDEDDLSSTWVKKLETSGTPSLYGENRAIFSAQVNKEAASLIMQSFDGVMPAGVVYDLTFTGMRRAFNVTVDVEWERLYDFMQERYDVDLVFVDIDSEKIVEELEENQIIQITSSLEEAGDDAMEEEFHAVREKLEEYVMETFFKQELRPVPEGDSQVTEEVISTIRKLGGWVQAGYSRRELSQDQVRSLDIDYTVARATERTIAPQAHLSLFFDDVNVAADDVIEVVEGFDDMWRSLEFRVSLNTDFAAEGLHDVTVDMIYGGDEDDIDADGEPDEDASLWSFHFEEDEADATPLVQSKRAWYDPEVGQKLLYHYHVVLEHDSVPCPVTSFESGWRTHTGNIVTITPKELYEDHEVTLALAEGFPLDQYPQTQAHVRFADADEGWTHATSNVLSGDETSFTARARTPAESTVSVQYRLDFRRADGELVETDWKSATTNPVVISDPFPDELRVLPVVAGDVDSMAMILLHLEYEGDGSIQDHTFVFSEEDFGTQGDPWVIELEDPEQRSYRYNQTIVYTRGEARQTGWIERRAEGRSVDTLIVGESFAKKMRVQPELVGPPLEDNDVEIVKVHFSYVDEENGVEAEKQMRFSVPGQGEIWEIRLQDLARRSYTYRVTYVFTDGFEQTEGPFTSRETFPVISTVPGE